MRRDQYHARVAATENEERVTSLYIIAGIVLRRILFVFLLSQTYSFNEQ